MITIILFDDREDNTTEESVATIIFIYALVCACVESIEDPKLFFEKDRRIFFETKTKNRRSKKKQKRAQDEKTVQKNNNSHHSSSSS